jgi:sn-glycerol 3-phosphate transport system ATP-binding protein
VASIALERVAKHWGATRAVDDVSFDVEAGTFAVLLGPSGCGKSTTLRLIAGLEAVTAGRVRIGGIDVTEAPPSKRNIAMVFQSYALFPHLSVAENILFGLKVRGVAAADRERRLKRVAELLGLDKLLARKPSQLSGGQQQRVALGRAIIAEHPVCLMDEPLSNLDAQLRHDMRREIRALQQKLGITMVYVTHDQTEAMSMADQVVLLREGRVEQDAAPAALYARPATAFAARFIGTPPMNLLRLADGPHGAVIRGTDGPVVAPGKGDGLLLGVRPESATIDPAGAPATVVSLEYLGADSIVACSVGEEPFTVRAPGKLDLAAGARIGIKWAREAQHFFHAGDGRRVGTVQDAAVAA